MRDAHPMILEALEGYFDNIVAAATNKELVLEDLVDNFTTLTASNAVMAYTIKKLTGENSQFQQQLNSLQKKLPHDDSCGAACRQPAVGRNKNLCCNCNQEVGHKSDY